MPNLQDARRQFPSLQGLNDDEAVNALHDSFYADLPREDVAKALGVKLAPPPAQAPGQTSKLRQIADVGVAGAQGVVGGVKMLSDVFGAGNAVSGVLGDASEGLSSLYSPGRMTEMQNRQRLIQEAEQNGSTWDQVKANIGGLTEAPVSTVVQGIGSIAPSMLAMLVPGGQVAAGANVARTAAMLGLGAAQGAGSVKGSIYDGVKRELENAGAPADVAEARAVEAQAYAGPNAGQIGLGAGIGAAAGRFGAEGAIERMAKGVGTNPKALVPRVAGGFATEGSTEALQGGQERFATNQALNNEGFAVDPLKGVAGNAALEGLVGGVIGGGLNLPAPRQVEHPAGDALRGQKVPEVGAMSKAVNVGIEAQAQAVDQTGVVPGVQQAAPVDDPVADRIRALPEGLKQDALRAYAVVNRDDLPKGVVQYNRKLLDRLLKQAEEPAAPGPAGPALLGYDQTHTGTMIAGEEGVRPQVRAELINAQQAADEREQARLAEDQRLIDLGLAPARRSPAAPPAPAIAPVQENHGNLPLDSTESNPSAIKSEAVENGASAAAVPAATQAGAFKTVEEADRYISAQRRAGGSRIQALPLPMPDGSFGVATNETAQFAEAEAFKVQRDRAAAGILPSDIVNKLGEPFKAKLPAVNAAKKAGTGFVPVEVKGGWVVRGGGLNVSNAAPVGAVDSGTGRPADSQLGGGVRDREQLATDPGGGGVERPTAPAPGDVQSVALGAADTPGAVEAAYRKKLQKIQAEYEDTADKPAYTAARAKAKSELEAAMAVIQQESAQKQPRASADTVVDAANNVAEADTTVAKSNDIAGKAIDTEWTAFSDTSGTLKIPRSDMPQIKAENRGAMVNFLAARGIKHEQAEVSAADLKPTQAEFSPGKVAKAKEFTGGDRSILVSSDGHVLDGHHQWLAKREAGEPVKVIRLKAPIKKLLAQVKEFPSAETAEGAAASKTQGQAETPIAAAQDEGAAQAVLLSRAAAKNPEQSYFKKMREIRRRREASGDQAAYEAEAAAAKADYDDARAAAPMQLEAGAFGKRHIPLTVRVRKALVSAKEKFAGKQVTNASDGLAIDIPASGLKHSMSGQVSEAALAAMDQVDELVRTAKYSHSTPDKKGRNTIKEVRFYDREAVLDGKPVNLRVVVRVAPDGRRYYDHFEIKEKAPAGLSGKQEVPDSTQPFTEASPDPILPSPEPDVNEPSEEDPLLKREQPRNEAGRFTESGISNSELNEALETLRSGGLTRIKVAQTDSDLPESGRERIKSEGIKGVRGMYDPATDTVWLVRENIGNLSEAYGVALHEMFHRGLRKTFGKNVDPLLNQIFLGNERVRQMANSYMKSLNISRLEAVEEVLADLAGMGVTSDLKGWDKLVAFIKDFLVKLSNSLKVNITFTDKMITDLVAGARRAGQADQVHLEPGSGPRYSRTGSMEPKAILNEAMGRTGGALANRLELGLNLLTRRQITDIYKADIPDLTTYSTLVQQMDADKNEVGAQADQLADRWGKLSDEKQLAELMHDATLARTDPALKYEERAGEKPLDRRASLVEHKALEDRFNALSDDAKKVYRETRDAYKVQYENIKQAIRENIERAIKDEPTRQKFIERLDTEFFKDIQGVYFPLARFGDYLVNVRDAAGELIAHHRAETLNEAQNLRVQLVAQGKSLGWDVGKVLKSKEFNARRDLAGKGFVKEIMDTLKAGGVDGNVIDSVAQLYLQSLPDLSWAKHGIHRKGTPGFSQDARRAFAANMFFGARYLAKLRYNDRLLESLASMQKQVDDGINAEDYDSVAAQKVVDHMNKRHDSLMNPHTNPLSTALTSIGFIFHLGLSPASAMVNLSQTALVAYPIMGAKWGYAKASAALLSASKLAVASKNDLSNALSGDEKAAYEQAVKDGTIDVTQAHDLAGIAQGEDSKVAWKIRPVMKWASFLFHHAERFNRQVTFVASYRLAREAGAAHDEAVEQATKATIDGHFDYSASNRAKAMQGNVARVVLLFKQYAQNMIYTLSRQAFLAMKGQSPEERAEARKALGGLLTMHAAAAGALGLPMVSTLLAAASFLGGDDDEPWDAKVAMQNMLADTFGPKAAEVMAHGLSRLTPWDISGRVGLDKLLLPDIQEGLEGGRWFESAATAALGPVVGIGLNALKGLQEVSEGHTVRGLENMMPTVLRGPLKAYRYATEGNVDRTGVVINDEVSPLGVAGQAAGFSPSETRAAQEVRSAIYSHDNALVERRKSLMNQYSMAKMAGDDEGAQEVREEIDGFNEKNPARRIKPIQLVQSVRRRQQRINDAEEGVYLPKNRRDAIGAVRFGEEATAE